MELLEPPNKEVTVTIEGLGDELDALWAKYLEYLDHYTKIQAEIQKLSSAGFLSLAKANSRASAGRRYGQDWYDQRMKAGCRTTVLEDTAEPRDDGDKHSGSRAKKLRLKVERHDRSSNARSGSGKGSGSGPGLKEPEQQPSPPSTPDPEPSKMALEDDGSEKIEDQVPVDPLKWFGILVPSELRKAQTSFSAAVGATPTPPPAAEGEKFSDTAGVSSPMVEAVNAACGMRETEAEIRRVRKVLRKMEKATGNSGT